jgi:hypothetical protein
MFGKSSIKLRLCLLMLMVTSLLLAGVAGAQVVKQGNDVLSSLAFTNDKLIVSEPIESFEDVESVLSPGLRNGWAAFRLGANVEWRSAVDKRTGQIAIAEGGGVAWVPGRGNALTNDDIAPFLGGRKKPDLAVVDAIARNYLPRVAALLGVNPSMLVLNHGRSGQPADHVWFVDYDVVRDGLTIEGARVVFRANNGNLVQFGTENLPSFPTRRLGRR